MLDGKQSTIRVEYLIKYIFVGTCCAIYLESKITQIRDENGPDWELYNPGAN